MKPRCAVVVPAHNEAKVIQRLLEALRKQTTLPAQVIIVDNTSTDATARIVSSYARTYPKLSISLVYEPQKGTGVACNTGFEVAITSGAELILRTDADCAPDPKWLERMIMDATTHGGAKLFAGRLVPLHDEWYKKGDELLLPLGLRIIRYGLVLQRRDRAYSNIAIGSNMMIRTDAYRAIGGFEKVGIDQKDEDIELSLRVYQRYGPGAVRYVHNARVAVSMRRPRTQGAWKTLFRHIMPNYRKRQTVHDVR